MICGSTHIGYVRETNEDAFFFDDKINLMIVADGIGGHEFGEKASKLAVETLKNYIYTYYSVEKEILLYQGFKAANKAVHLLQDDLGEGKICGTTLTAALVYNDILYFCHVGDSRIYVSRNKSDIEQISYDHTYLSELARNDFQTFIEIQGNNKTIPNNYLTKAIGPDIDIEPQQGHFKVKNNDYIILLTDGIYRYLKLQDILKMLRSFDNISDVLENMIDTSLSMGGKDNLTAIIAQYESKRGEN